MGFTNGVRRGLQIRTGRVKHGVLFMRFFYVVIIAVLMTALFTTLLYNYTSRTVFASIKEEDMRPRAQALARAVEAQNGEKSGESALNDMLALIGADDHGESLLGAYFVITDAEGNIRYASDTINLGDRDTRDIVEEAALRVVAGEDVSTSGIQGLKNSNIALVSAPIEEGGERAGAVLMFVPMVETIFMMSSLNGTLIMSLLLSLPLVVSLIYYVIGLIVRPLRQMRDVALSMSAGSFAARADERQRGEIGELARSLNHLSRQLGRSLDDLTIERNRLRQMVDGLNEGLVAVDSLNNVTHGNPALKNLFRTASGDARDGKLALIPIEGVWDDFGCVLKTGEGIERQIILPDRILRMSITPLVGTLNATVGAVGMFQDITESERLERTRRDYVANVSHEMRTPLTAMRGLIEPLSDGMVTSEETKMRYYAIMMRETLRLSRLIDDLMALSSLQSGNVTFDEREVDLRALIGELEDKYSQPMEEHELEFEIELSAKFEIKAFSNPDRVEQVLVILLDNAMKYTPEGGHVSIGAEEVDEKITICVRDTGVGISKEDQMYIFDRFYKVDKAHSGLGSGLGLSIAHEMVRLMGEEIWVESEVGKGSAFYFTLKRFVPPLKSQEATE